MIFTTPTFFTFFILFIILWWGVIPSQKTEIRKAFLIFSSYFFYSFTVIQWILTLFITSLFTYLLAKSISKSKNNKKKIGIFAVSTLIIQLIFWKYVPWAILTWNEMPFINQDLYIIPPEFLFPIGLSFFTFNALSLIIPVWVEKKESCSLLDTFAHISFFPALLAGPVLRYDNINYRWKEKWKWENVEWTNGIIRILIGATFKWVLASKCAEYSEIAFNGMYENSMQVLIGVHAYALQIFFDFAGYSHMAIGFALLMGWRLPENFTHPYTSLSIQEFWRNWHRSLSYFFRDNLYIHALGGNKNGKTKALFNAFLTMLVSGLWHGANITFVLWGAYHGLLLVMQNIFCKLIKIKMPKIISWLVTFELVVIGWVLFKSESIDYAFEIYKKLFDISDLLNSNIELTLNGYFWFTIIIIFLFCEKRLLIFVNNNSNKIDKSNSFSFKDIMINLTTVLLFSIWTYLIIYYGPVGVPDFIYNGF